MDSEGEVWFNREPADQGFLEPGSGIYWQVSGKGHEPFPSRSLWDRRLAFGSAHNDDTIHVYTSTQFPDEKLRVVERDAKLPGSDVRWRFQVAQSREAIDDQIRRLRSTLIWSFSALGVGLLVLAALQTFYGLWPLRRVRNEVAAIRSGEAEPLVSASAVSACGVTGVDCGAAIRPAVSDFRRFAAQNHPAL